MGKDNATNPFGEVALHDDCPWRAVAEKSMHGQVDVVSPQLGDTVGVLKHLLIQAGVWAGHDTDWCPPTHRDGQPTRDWANLVKSM